MPKHRTLIPPDVAARVLFRCDYTCCVCRERGRPIQLHHIDEDPSNNAEANLAPLCLLCHNDTQIQGGFGRKLNSDVVTRYLCDWCTRVASRRDKADELAALRMAGATERVPTTVEEAAAFMVPVDEALTAYAHSLPNILENAYAVARPRWDSGITSEMRQGTYDLIDVVIQIAVHLASWFPVNHFGERPFVEYFSDLVSSRFVWHWALAEPHGAGTGGTIAGPSTAAAVLDDTERAVDQMVTSLLRGRDGFNLKFWRRQWEQAKS
jgi:hypothetical protein